MESDRMEYEEFTDKQIESQEDDKIDDSDSNDDSDSEDDSDCCTNNYVIKMKHGDVDADDIVEYNMWQRDRKKKLRALGLPEHIGLPDLTETDLSTFQSVTGDLPEGSATLEACREARRAHRNIWLTCVCSDGRNGNREMIKAAYRRQAELQKERQELQKEKASEMKQGCEFLRKVEEDKNLKKAWNLHLSK